MIMLLQLFMGRVLLQKKITHNENAVVKDSQNNKANCAVLERKIESGEMSLHPLISKEVSYSIQTARNAIKTGEKTLTQKDLASLANQRGGRGVTPKDVSDIESGNMRLTTDNKLKIQAVKKALNMK